jgi:hypothetical protein
MRRIGVIFMQALPLLIIVNMVYGCSGNSRRDGQRHKSEAVQAKLNTAITLAFNQIASVEDEKILIEFADLTEDSRCPVNVTCVWEGQVTVALNISIDGAESGSISLTSRAGHEKLAIADIEGYSIRLEKVEPPKTLDEIDFSEYIITVIISKIQ